jgi:hypothetical protein
MRHVYRLAVLSVSIMGAGVLVATASHADSRIVVRPNAENRADAKTVEQIVATFDRMQVAMEAKDLKGLMALYSDHYNHGGLTKKDLEEFWRGLFAHYNRLIGHHIFTKIIVSPDKEKMALVTCTGAFWGTLSEKGKREPIDSWFEEEHHLVYENNEWKLVGAGPAAARPPEFGKAPHPPF